MIYKIKTMKQINKKSEKEVLKMKVILDKLIKLFKVITWAVKASKELLLVVVDLL